MKLFGGLSVKIGPVRVGVWKSVRIGKKGRKS